MLTSVHRHLQGARSRDRPSRSSGMNSPWLVAHSYEISQYKHLMRRSTVPISPNSICQWQGPIQDPKQPLVRVKHRAGQHRPEAHIADVLVQRFFGQHYCLHHVPCPKSAITQPEVKQSDDFLRRNCLGELIQR